ncbi:hypothetical protein BG015_005569, partial [Linnemannia schmuckeri]
FQWAVDEKKRLAEQDEQNIFSIKGCHMEKTKAQSSSHQPEFWRKRLVPIEELHISGFSRQVVKDEVNYAAFALSQTLRQFEAYYYYYDTASRSGEGWVDMPVLTRLSLIVSTARLLIDLQLLSLCSNVVSVQLFDEAKEYQCDDIEPCLSVYLPHLKSLTLQGTPALSFHPDTLHSTAELTDLLLIIAGFVDDDEEDDFENELPDYDGDDFMTRYCFVPSVGELYRSYGIQDDFATSLTPPKTIRPIWSWDWDLPRLVSLKLFSEFAFLSQFQMFQGCPALQTFELEMRTFTAQPTRTLIETNMIHPSSGELIVLPVLTKLRMHGSWIFPGPAFALKFLTSMFPNLESLSALDGPG